MNRVVCPKCDAVAMVRSLSNPNYLRCGVCDIMVRTLEQEPVDGEELFTYHSHRADVAGDEDVTAILASVSDDNSA